MRNSYEWVPDPRGLRLSFVGLYSVVLNVASIVIHYQLTKRLDKHVSKGVLSKLNSSKEMDLPK